MNNLSVYDSCIESGFNVSQSRKLVELFDNQEKTAFQSVNIIKDDIRVLTTTVLIIQSDIKEIKVILKMLGNNLKILERMIYVLSTIFGTIMIGGFGVLGWLIK